ncbi:MAG: alpha/beta fold hydrolase [Bacteroidota bacterium]
MNIVQHNFSVQKTARYFSFGSPKEKIKNLWILLHGYSHNAGEFVKQFEILNDDETMIVAAEGLSRFYVKGYFGNVGASWMTKEDRMNDIIDNIHYLDSLVSKIKNDLKNTPEKIIVLGFSQGGATAARWAAMTNHKIHHLIIHSSEFPNDIADDAMKHLNEKTKTWFVYSDKDEFIDEDLFAAQFRYLELKNFSFEKVFFEGKHEVKKEALERLRVMIDDRRWTIDNLYAPL